MEGSVFSLAGEEFRTEGLQEQVFLRAEGSTRTAVLVAGETTLYTFWNPFGVRASLAEVLHNEGLNVLVLSLPGFTQNPKMLEFTPSVWLNSLRDAILENVPYGHSLYFGFHSLACVVGLQLYRDKQVTRRYNLQKPTLFMPPVKPGLDVAKYANWGIQPYDVFGLDTHRIRTQLKIILKLSGRRDFPALGWFQRNSSSANLDAYPLLYDHWPARIIGELAMAPIELKRLLASPDSGRTTIVSGMNDLFSGDVQVPKDKVSKLGNPDHHLRISVPQGHFWVAEYPADAAKIMFDFQNFGDGLPDLGG